MKNCKFKTIIKVVFSTILIIAFLIPASVWGQDKPEALPLPVGGIKAIAQKVIYPAEAKEENIQGKVVVKALIDEKGDVIETSVLKSIGYGCDEAAIQAIKSVKFIPAKKDGKNISAEVTIPIMFKLDKDKGALK